MVQQHIALANQPEKSLRLPRKDQFLWHKGRKFQVPSVGLIVEV